MTLTIFLLSTTVLSSAFSNEISVFQNSGISEYRSIEGKVVDKIFLEVLCDKKEIDEKTIKRWEKSSPDEGMLYLFSDKVNFTANRGGNLPRIQLNSTCNRKKDYASVCVSVGECSGSIMAVDVTRQVWSVFDKEDDTAIKDSSFLIDHSYVSIKDVKMVFIYHDLKFCFNKCDWKFDENMSIWRRDGVGDDICEVCQSLAANDSDPFAFINGSIQSTLSSSVVQGISTVFSITIDYVTIGDARVVVKLNSSSGMKELWHSMSNQSSWEKEEILVSEQYQKFTVVVDMIGNDISSFVAIRKIETGAKKETKEGRRYCEFSRKTCGFLSDMHCDMRVQKGGKRLDDQLKRSYGKFLFISEKDVGKCGTKKADSDFDATSRLRSKVFMPTTEKPCKISWAWYGEAHWTLDVISPPNTTGYFKNVYEHYGTNEIKKLEYIEITLPNISNRFELVLEMFSLKFGRYFALDYMSISEGCLLQEDVVEISSGNSLSTDMVLLSPKRSHAIQVYLPVFLVIAGVFLAAFFVIVIKKKRRFSNYLPFLHKEKSKDRRIAVTDLLSHETSPSAIQDILTERNPNYEWFSERLLNGTVNDYSRSRIRIESMIGKGAFGEVYRGVLERSNDHENDIYIAIKQLPNGAEEKAKNDFLFEALTLCKFQHKNIVQCLGISTDNYGIYILLELMLGGDLKTFLKTSRNKETLRPTLKVAEMISLARDIASGCHYLESNKFVHRDIAARNCLLTCKEPGRVAKIADFGLARDVVMTDYYRKEGHALLPVRWMSPESFNDGHFSSKSDVWAFGILLWEIFTAGFIPYPGLSNMAVLPFVSGGGRLEPPVMCPTNVYNTMLWCWNADKDSRPSFKQVISDLDLTQKIYDKGSQEILKSGATFKEQVCPRYYRKSDPDGDDSSSVMLIDEICKNGI